ncbi:hypothetical protein Dsin_004452 [Dipteronia sinensis]|uniref:Reverse transcriptase domain-containing protein n=1 Tax=Dipteronia sinensis TaxID=43782 RepID=A0AAE0EFI8_9ROSI|nr:hypothetical protein Dsin_004452 [Dipteronia sinensis]
MFKAGFNCDEVWVAVSDCDENKALGHDGMNLNLIRSNWEVIQEDFMKFIECFHDNSSTVKGLNSTFITIIPKCTKLESMKDFCPISLVGSIYKVLAKVLANQLKKVMNSIISDCQMVFVKDRRIVDNFIIAKEIVHKWQRDKEGGLLIKLDFEKAYDSVDHSFLDNMIRNMGFGEKWRKWMRDCISTPDHFSAYER